MKTYDLDIAVLGSGFGGTITALIAKQLGFRVAVFDAAQHPRFAIGESSTPLADRLLCELATRYDLPELTPLSAYGSWTRTYPQLNVGRKRGFTYLRHHAMQPFEANGDDLLMVAASSSNELSDTHWYRPDLDSWLAGRCRDAGIDVFEGYQAELTRGDHKPWKLQDLKGAGPDVTAHLLVDATGSAGLVPKFLNVRQTDPKEFQTHSAAVFGHWHAPAPAASFAGLGDQSNYPFAIDDSAIHHLLDEGWMWQLRFDDERVSIGICFDGEDRVTPEWLARVAFTQPTLAMQISRSLKPPEHVQGTGRLQRRLAEVAGNDWAALPHTIGFVDPMHSTGIALTLGGISKLASQLERWKAGTPASDTSWGLSPVIDELQRIDRLVAMAYATRRNPRAFEASVLLYTACAMASETATDTPHQLFVDQEHQLDRAVSMATTQPFWPSDGEAMIDWVREQAANVGINAIAEPAHRGMYSATATKN